MASAAWLFSLAALLLGIASVATFRAGSQLRETSLRSATRWGLAAQIAWLLCCVLSLAIPEKHAILDQFWSWAAILSLCPFISALGARRPTDRVWNAFIVWPLIPVLGWPAITAWGYGDHLPPVRLGWPPVAGFCLVLVMGLGNWLGTRFTGPALLAGFSIPASMVPLLSRWDFSLVAALWRGTAALGLGLASLWAWHAAQRCNNAPDRFDDLWLDFRDTFGIVWSLRIQERVNAAAVQENWPCRLDSWGFQWSADVTPQQRSQTQPRLEHTFRWLLRRFVDEEWINRRLMSAPPNQIAPPAGPAG